MNIRVGEEEWFSNLQSVFRNPFSNGYKHNIKSSSEKGVKDSHDTKTEHKMKIEEEDSNS